MEPTMCRGGVQRLACPELAHTGGAGAGGGLGIAGHFAGYEPDGLNLGPMTVMTAALRKHCPVRRV